MRAMSATLGRLVNSHGEALDHVWRPAAGDGAPVVVIGHGLTSEWDRPWQAELAEQLAARGLGSLRFSFSGNGASEGTFLDSCPTKEARDLSAVLDALEARGAGPLAYVGHSMGALVGVLTAGRGEERLGALVSLAGMVHARAFADVHLAHLGTGGAIVGKADKPLGDTLLADLTSIDTVLPLAPRVAVPWLLVHGDDDEIVPVQDSVDAAGAAGEGAELVVLEGHDHSARWGFRRWAFYRHERPVAGPLTRS